MQEPAPGAGNDRRQHLSCIRILSPRGGASDLEARLATFVQCGRRRRSRRRAGAGAGGVSRAVCRSHTCGARRAGVVIASRGVRPN
jgi:hypothetical protein